MGPRKLLERNRAIDVENASNANSTLVTTLVPMVVGENTQHRTMKSLKSSGSINNRNPSPQTTPKGKMMFKSTILAALALAAFSGIASAGILDVNPYGEDTWGTRQFNSMDRRPTSDFGREGHGSTGFSNRWHTRMPEALPAIVPYNGAFR